VNGFRASFVNDATRGNAMSDALIANAQRRHAAYVETLDNFDRWVSRNRQDFLLYQIIARLMLERGPHGTLADENELMTVDEMRDVLSPYFFEFDRTFLQLRSHVEQAAAELIDLLDSDELLIAVVGSPEVKSLKPLEQIRLAAQLTARLSEAVCGVVFIDYQTRPASESPIPVFHLDRFPALAELDFTKLTDAAASIFSESFEPIASYLLNVAAGLLRNDPDRARVVFRVVAKRLLEIEYPVLTHAVVQQVVAKLGTGVEVLAKVKGPLAALLIGTFALGLLRDNYLKDPSLKNAFEISGQVADLSAGLLKVTAMLRQPGVSLEVAGGALAKHLGAYAGLAGVASSAFDAIDAAFKDRDYSVAAGNATAFGGGLVLLFAGGPVGIIVGVVLVVGGSLYALLTQDSPLEQWLQGGRFGRFPADVKDAPLSATFQFIIPVDKTHNIARQISAFYSLSASITIKFEPDHDEDGNSVFLLDVDLSNSPAYPTSAMRVVPYRLMTGVQWHRSPAGLDIPLNQTGDARGQNVLGWRQTWIARQHDRIVGWKGYVRPIPNSGTCVEVQLDLLPGTDGVTIISNRVIH
jgi:hypothetical protein